MKILQKICFVFMSAILFFGTYGWFTNEQTINFENNSVLHNSSYSWFDFNEQIDIEVDKTMVVNKLTELARQYKVQLIKTVYTEKGIDKYLFGNFKNTKEFLYSKESADFLNNETIFSTNPQDQEKQMYYVDKSKEYRVLPFESLKNSGYLKNSISVTGESQNDIDAFYNSVLADYPNNTLSLNTSQDIMQEDRSFYQVYLSEIIILGALYLVCMCFSISKQLKKVTVLRINGHSYSSIVRKLFFKDFCISIGLSGLLFIILFLYFFKEINVFSVGVIIRLFEIILIQSIICLVIFILLCIMLGIHFKYQSLKNRNLNKECTSLSFVLKIIIIFLIMPQIVSGLKDIQGINEYYTYSNKILEKLDGYSICTYKEGYGTLSIEEEQEMKEDYEYLNDRGLVFFSRSYIGDAEDRIYDNVQMNANALELFLDKTGNKQSSVYYYNENKSIDTIVKDTGFKNGGKVEQELIDIQYLFSPYKREEMPIEIDKSAVIFVLSDEDNKNVNFIGGTHFIKGEAEEVEKQLAILGYNEKVHVKGLNEVVSEMRQAMIFDNLTTIFKLCIYLVVSFVISILTLLFYHYSYIRKNTILSILGYSFFEKYKIIIFELLMTYILMGILAYMLSSSSLMMFVLGYIGLEILILSIYCIYFSKNKKYRGYI